jgi:hypothetical protein
MNTMTVNGNARSADVYPAVPLLWAGLRAVLQIALVGLRARPYAWTEVAAAAESLAASAHRLVSGAPAVE